MDVHQSPAPNNHAAAHTTTVDERLDNSAKKFSLMRGCLGQLRATFGDLMSLMESEIDRLERTDRAQTVKNSEHHQQSSSPGAATGSTPHMAGTRPSTSQLDEVSPGHAASPSFMSGGSPPPAYSPSASPMGTTNHKAPTYNEQQPHHYKVAPSGIADENAGHQSTIGALLGAKQVVSAESSTARTVSVGGGDSPDPQPSLLQRVAAGYQQQKQSVGNSKSSEGFYDNFGPTTATATIGNSVENVHPNGTSLQKLALEQPEHLDKKEKQQKTLIPPPSPTTVGASTSRPLGPTGVTPYSGATHQPSAASGTLPRFNLTPIAASFSNQSAPHEHNTSIHQQRPPHFTHSIDHAQHYQQPQQYTALSSLIGSVPSSTTTAAAQQPTVPVQQPALARSSSQSFFENFANQPSKRSDSFSAMTPQAGSMQLPPQQQHQAPTTSHGISDHAVELEVQRLLSEGVWQELRDEGTGNSYFYNPSRRRTTYDLRGEVRAKLAMLQGQQ